MRRCTLRHARAAARTHPGGEIQSLKTNKIIGELFLSYPRSAALSAIATPGFYTFCGAHRAPLKARVHFCMGDEFFVRSSRAETRRLPCLFISTDPPPPQDRSPRVGHKAESISATRFAINGRTCDPHVRTFDQRNQRQRGSTRFDTSGMRRTQNRERERERGEKERGIRTAVWSHMRHPINLDEVSYRGAGESSAVIEQRQGRDCALPSLFSAFQETRIERALRAASD